MALVNLIVLVKLLMYLKNDYIPWHIPHNSLVRRFKLLYISRNRESLKIGLGNQMSIFKKANIDDAECHGIQPLHPRGGIEHGIGGCCLVSTNRLSK